MSPYQLLKVVNPFKIRLHWPHYEQTDHDHRKQLLTHHDRNKSVAVSAVVNNANTIQYIIHFTWMETHTHRNTRTHTQSEKTPKNST